MYTKLILLAALASCGRHSEHTYRYGSDGINGKPGSSGHSSLLATTSFSGVSGSCTNGGIVVLSGLDTNDSGTLDSADTNLVSSYVCNGTNGSNGTNGTNGSNAPPSPFTPVTILDPCGNSSGVFDEVMLKLYNGQILASFSDNVNGYNTRFSIIGAGSYMVTDGSHCYFSIDSLGNMYNEHF
jgi:hypothetical protein